MIASAGPKKGKKSAKKPGKGGNQKLQQASQPAPPSHSTVDYSHWDKLDIDSDQDSEKDSFYTKESRSEGSNQLSSEDEGIVDEPRPKKIAGPDIKRRYQQAAEATRDDILQSLDDIPPQLKDMLVSNPGMVKEVLANRLPKGPERLDTSGPGKDSKAKSEKDTGKRAQGQKVQAKAGTDSKKAPAGGELAKPQITFCPAYSLL